MLRQNLAPSVRLQRMSTRVLEHEKNDGLAPGSRGQPTSANGFYPKYGKRILDIIAATAGLIVFSPVLVFAACCVRLTSRGPVLYRQIRIGRGGHPFQILKFRSMTVQSSDTDLQITVAETRE